MVAVPFQVFQITGSTLAVGLLALCELFPLLVLSLIGGAIADRVDRRRLLRATYGVLPVFSLVLALNARLPHPHLWVLYAFATLSTAAYALYSPAVRSAPPLLFSKEELPAVFALTGVYYSFGSLVGPAVAGVLIATIKLQGTYLVDVATFLVALGTLAMMDPLPRAGEKDLPERFLDAVREGFRFLKGKPVLQSTFTFDLDAMIFGMPMALFPAVAAGLEGGAKTVGLLYAAPYGGALFVTLFSGRAKHVRRQGQAVMASIVVWGAALIAFSLSRSLWLALLMLAVAGGADMWSGIFRTTIAQSVVPDAMRGRLSGIELAVVATGPALGDLEAGVVGSLVSVPFAIVSGGIACIAGVFALGLLVPQFARYDARHPTP
jgi:MFS family permease